MWDNWDSNTSPRTCDPYMLGGAMSRLTHLRTRSDMGQLGFQHFPRTCDPYLLGGAMSGLTHLCRAKGIHPYMLGGAMSGLTHLRTLSDVEQLGFQHFPPHVRPLHARWSHVWAHPFGHSVWYGTIGIPTLPSHFKCPTLCLIPEQRKLPAQRAKYKYLRGKILDVLPDYRKEAEDHLSKAVRNNALWLPVVEHEKDERMQSNPDLYFNCATGHAISKRLLSLGSSLAAVNCTLHYSFIELLISKSYCRYSIRGSELNKSVALVGKVLFFIKHDNVAPLYYVACDSNQICFVVSVYGIQYDSARLSSLYEFKSLHVDFIEQLLVNGKALAPHQSRPYLNLCTAQTIYWFRVKYLQVIIGNEEGKGEMPSVQRTGKYYILMDFSFGPLFGWRLFFVVKGRE
ncbi:hypothetical protein DVH24_040382 [Malus domestica]|uniref:Tetratricopeptide repeat protein 5 OB fold domain-containing protein n=1 Tax=Malus domestica TaxID=3750 RepID=A0A498IB81_MALDO|nr:hypothetical protein DVH24_040382 [Malus domestica]